jgi:hypothetical protein
MRSTIRDSGLQRVNPFASRIAVSTRIRNQGSAQAEANDADGNPIEIAAVVVCRCDTAHAPSTATRASSRSRPIQPSGDSQSS